MIVSVEQEITKTCTKCGETKRIAEFSKQAKKKSGINSECKACNSVRSREYYRKHREEILEQKREYQQEHKEEIAVRMKMYSQKPGVKIVANVAKRKYRQSLKGKANRKEYQQSLEGKMVKIKSGSKRRAQKRNVLYEIFDPVEVFERDGWRCQHCHKKVQWYGKMPNHPLYPNLDHIIALANGGAHTKQNTQLLCRACNSKKHTNDAGEQLRLFG